MEDADPDAGWDFGRLTDSISLHLRRARHMLAVRYASAIARGPVPVGGITTLAAIGANPGVSQQELVAATGLNKSTLVEIIDAFEHEGWAERRESLKDRRRRELRLTPKGERTLAESLQILADVEAAATRTFTDKDRKTLITLLARLVAEMERSAAD